MPLPLQAQATRDRLQAAKDFGTRVAVGNAKVLLRNKVGKWLTQHAFDGDARVYQGHKRAAVVSVCEHVAGHGLASSQALMYFAPHSFSRVQAAASAVEVRMLTSAACLLPLLPSLSSAIVTMIALAC